ncbi:MAG: hypothetical protein LJE59_00430 [Chromatiaceae bacterium]|nr:hypothetical protein [Chromatiaceae bacterium]
MTRFARTLLHFCLAMLSPPAVAAELVVHPSVPEHDLTVNMARLVFTMRLLRWPNGKRVKVFVLPDQNPLHREFTKEALDLYPRQLRRVWDRNLYAGSGPVPVEVATVQDMARLVSETPGAIGYLPNDFDIEAVRVIHVK